MDVPRSLSRQSTDRGGAPELFSPRRGLSPMLTQPSTPDLPSDTHHLVVELQNGRFVCFPPLFLNT